MVGAGTMSRGHGKECAVKKHHVLIDACVAAAFFAEKTTRSKKLRTRAMSLFKGGSESFETNLLIPNFCIAEVFSVFEKYRWGRTWNRHVSKANSLTKREFQAARKGFGEAVHNGSRVNQCELNRYHILSVDLISPVNNAYRIKRDRARKQNVVPAQTYDMLIVAMGIWLQKQLGKPNFTIVTGDDRIAAVVKRARSVTLNKTLRAHLESIASRLGLRYGADLYPEVISFAKATQGQLRERFPNWTPAW